jgi:hypothetical protein
MNRVADEAQEKLASLEKGQDKSHLDHYGKWFLQPK